MLLKLHPKIEQALSNTSHGTIIDGAFATQIYDTTGEILDIASADISSLNEDGIMNTEHLNPEKAVRMDVVDTKNFKEAKEDQKGSWGVIVGRIIFAKKILKEDDCESEREAHLWAELQCPFIYGAVELFDAEDHENAKSLAAIIKHYARRGQPLVTRYSIEGHVLDRQGQTLKQALCRRVACTLKPANRSAYSSLVEESAIKPTQHALEKKEDGTIGHISIFEMSYSPLIEDNPVQEARDAISELKKAFGLGSSNAAPGSLTGGAAVSVEDFDDRDKKKKDKSQVMAAFRDWNGVTPFKAFLKSRLPEVSDDVLGRFMELANEINITKREKPLHKAEVYADDYSNQQPLVELNTSKPKGAIVFKNKHIIPGQIELVAGPYQGNKLKLLGIDDNYVYVQPLKAGDDYEVKVNKINRKLEGSHYIIVNEPQDLQLPNYVHAIDNADQVLTRTYPQQELIHGLDLGSEPLLQTHPHGATEARTKGVIGWYRSAHGKICYVKPAVEFDRDDYTSKHEEYLSTAKREVIFYNLAATFFGLTEYVPTTAMFYHPTDKHDYSAMELVPQAEHIQIKDRAHQNEWLVNVGDMGILDKLAVMDIVMGSSDRNRLNYLVSPNPPHIYLIDNALTLNFKDEYVPAYLTDYHQLKGASLDSSNLHPDVASWIVRLDPLLLANIMSMMGIHDTIVKASVHRLMCIQSSIVCGVRNKSRVLFSFNNLNGGL